MNRLKAFTLIETMVALTIIMMVFGFVIGIISQTLTASNAGRRSKAYLSIYDLAIKTKKEHDFIMADFPRPPYYTLHRDFEHYKGSQHLLLMTITARDPDKKEIGSYQEIVIADE
ncbi:MAG: type II secretion system protein [Bacteroidetes bacterium]|nr:type II secretion system protein [Bacteroidota bacterium]